MRKIEVLIFFLYPTLRVMCTLLESPLLISAVPTP